MRRRILSITLLCALGLAAAAGADYCFESKTWQEGSNATELANMRVTGCVDGKRIGMTFVESGNPYMTEKHRIVAQDVTDVIYLVDDENQSYSPWDINAILNAAGTILSGMGPLLKIEVENVRMATLDRSDATFLGRPVEWVKIESEYDVSVKIMGFKNQQHVKAVEELWIDHDLDLGFKAWFDRDPPDLGTEFNKLWELEKQKLGGGVALKTVRWETSTGKKGKNVSELKTITEIVRLAEESAPAGTYSWPDHYQLVNAMPTAEQLAGSEAGEEDESAEEEGWQSKLPFGKRRGDG